MLALKKLGASIRYDRNFQFESQGLKGADILLDEASVTATENAIMACTTAKGKSVIRNAASEPHIQELMPFSKFARSGNPKYRFQYPGNS